MSACSEQRLSPLTTDATILAFGDSLTEGKGTTSNKSYPAVLENISGIEVINDGISGEISELGLERLEDSLIEYEPDLIIICHGGNDILRKLSYNTLKQNLSAMIELAQAYNVEVILVAVPELKLLGSYPPLYQELADQYNIPFESEVLNTLLKSNKYKSDHVHPNAEGYRLFAQAIFELMEDEGAINN